METTPQVIAVPATFYQDHYERFGSANSPESIGRKGRAVLIRTSDPFFRELEADARYYAGDNMDECPRWLRESAKRTLAAIAKAVSA